MIFDPEKLKNTLTEIERFKAAVVAHGDRLAEDETYAKYWHIVGGPETAAIERASLDLTRSLATLRRRGP